MKLLKEILIISAVLAALSSTLAFADATIVLLPNNHGSYNQIFPVPDRSAMIGLSVNGSGGSNALGNSACTAASCGSTMMDRAHGSSAVYPGTTVTLRDNAHGQQVPR